MTKQQEVHAFSSEPDVRMNNDIYYLSIEELQHRIRSRDVSSTYIVERCFERTEGIDEPVLGLEDARRARDVAEWHFRMLGFGASMRIGDGESDNSAIRNTRKRD
jgi:hypothetical protein